MIQLRPFCIERLDNFCSSYKNHPSTRDHVLSNALELNKSLRDRIDKDMPTINQKRYFMAKHMRVSNVLLKLEKGHAQYHDSKIQQQFLFPEIESKALQVTLISSGQDSSSYWIEIQIGGYSYSFCHELKEFGDNWGKFGM